jgi:hypothetical protein
MKYHWTLALCAMSGLFADDVLPPEYVAAAVQPVHAQVESQPVAPQYKNRFGFNFDRLVYERTDANCMYFGLDVWASAIFSHNRNRHLGALAEAEVRGGYNFFYNGRDHLAPIAGVGYMYNNVGRFHHAKFAYATAGLLYSHEFNSVFGWGLNLKGLAGQQLANAEAKKFAWGIDLSMPIIFRFAHYRHWDVTLEPFYLYMESHHKHQGVLGGRGTIGYRF